MTRHHYYIKAQVIVCHRSKFPAMTPLTERKPFLEMCRLKPFLEMCRLKTEPFLEMCRLKTWYEASKYTKPSVVHEHTLMSLTP